MRDELLNGEIFDAMTEAKVLIEKWRAYYNTIRPHSSLDNMTPSEFAGQLTIRTNKARLDFPPNIDTEEKTVIK